MRKEILLLFVILCIFTQCKKLEQKDLQKTKVEQIFAENDYGFGDKVKFEMYADSSYIFTLTTKSSRYEKTEKFKGFCYSKKDTLYFKPFEFGYTDSEKAVIKNGFIEFISEDSSFRIEIKRNKLKIENRLDLSKFQDYAIFTYYEKDSVYKPYDISQEELEEIDTILTNCFVENKDKLKSRSDYVKQCIIVKNNQNEIEVWIDCFCKSDHIEKSFKYNSIMMEDGGRCNISLKINLSKKQCTNLIIAGLA